MAQDDATTPSGSEDPDKPARDEEALARKWAGEIKTAERAQMSWLKRAEKIEKKYCDDREENDDVRKFNIFWSNVQTLQPAIYSQTPKARAVRRYRDRDPIARFASLLIERSVQTSCDLYDFDAEMDQVVRDRLVPGRGQAWVFYEPEFEGEGEAQMLAYENVVCEYVPWRDFLHAVTRTWRECRWAGRWLYKTRREAKELLAQLGLDEATAEAKSRKLALDHSVGSKRDESERDDRAKVRIFELWDKIDRKVRYIAPGSGKEAYLGDRDPPVRFREFWPCPEPFLATTRSGSLIPTPDFALYQDQARELDTTTERIGVLQKALKVAGLYNQQNQEIPRLLTSPDNDMIPVESWAIFTEGGGARGNVEWFPVEQVVLVLEKLYQTREQCKQTIYEISGIGDILRGDSDPNETATAQGIKARWGSLRVRRTQRKLTTFMDRIFELKAEVICQRFRFQEILQMAGADQEMIAKYAPPNMPPEQFLSEVEKLLRDDASRAFRVTVQPDSMLEPDRQEEKQAAVEFLTAVGGFVQQASPLAGQGPEGAKLAGDLLMFGVRRFDGADELEQTIEQFVEAMAKPKPPAPDPEMMKAETEAKATEAKLKIEARKVDASTQNMATKTQADIATKVMKTQADIAIAQEKSAASTDIAAQNAAAKQAIMEGSPP